MAVDILIEAPAWLRALPEAERVVERAARATFAIATLPDDGAWECAVLLADDSRLQELNRRFRGQDKPTNVLSFPADPREPDYANEVQMEPAEDQPLPYGDVAIAYGTTAAEAAEQGKTLADHLSHLVVHGLLHLIGHDHETAAEAERMEALERQILWEIGIADPYEPPEERT
ncbi:MAG TPA: rRNA maturation RNase YbeY [Kiloniellales bacterium]|nr:rRNA maturation RNase YbeY [Kiloniellales bacterium]